MPESFYSSPPVAPPPSRLVPACLCAGSTEGAHFHGRYREWRRLSCPEARPGSRRGPTFLGVPLHAVSASHRRRGTPEPLRLVRCGMAWPDPHSFGSSAYRTRDWRSGITAAAALSRVTSPPMILPPLAVIGDEAASSPGFFASGLRAAASPPPASARVFPRRSFRRQPSIHQPSRSLSRAAKAQPHVRADLPRSPSPCRQRIASAPWGPGAPSACALRAGMAGSRSFGSSADPPALAVRFRPPLPPAVAADPRAQTPYPDDLLGILPKSHPACVGPVVRPSAARVAETTPCVASITEAVAFRQLPEGFCSSPPVAPPPSRLVPTCLSAGSTLRQASTDRAGASLGRRRHGRTCGPTFLGVPAGTFNRLPGSRNVVA